MLIIEKVCVLIHELGLICQLKTDDVRKTAIARRK